MLNNKQIFTRSVASMLSIMFVLSMFSSCKKTNVKENNSHTDILYDDINQYYDEYNKKLDNYYLGKYNLFEKKSLNEADNKIIDLIFKELCKIDENFNKLDTMNFRQYVMSYFIASYNTEKLNFFDVKKIINSINIEKSNSQTCVNLNLFEDSDEYQNISFGTSSAGGFLIQELKDKNAYIYSYVNSNTILYDITNISEDINFCINAHINDFNMHISITLDDVNKTFYTEDENEIYYLFKLIFDEYSYGDFELIEFIRNHEDEFINILGEDIFNELNRKEKKLVKS